VATPLSSPSASSILLARSTANAHSRVSIPAGACASALCIRNAATFEKAAKWRSHARALKHGGCGLYGHHAGRTAYLAGFHAAQAFIFETTQKVFKSHKGVQTEFLRLTKNDPRFTADQRIFLSQTYNLKAIADYETGPGSEVSAERAKRAVDAGKQFVEHIAGLLPPT
jgi:uncharacterized protein (UPF0332 family)